MMRTLKDAARGTARRFGIDSRLRAARIANAGSVTLDGHRLPPASIRLGGHNFADDRAFLDAALRDARRLEQTCGVHAGSRVLDIGCGVGRLPIGLRARFGTLAGYTGVDVDAGCIGWCRKNLGGGGATLVHVDLANERYNPSGAAINGGFRLPLADAGFDVIHLYSVFSHMEGGDVRAYLKEFRRLLAPGGRVFLTAFIEEGVEDQAVNPDGYGSFPGEWEGALHCVRFDRGFFDSMVSDAGLIIERFDHASDTDGQSAVFLRAA
jgi:SAM-dependent methyltransferase